MALFSLLLCAVFLVWNIHNAYRNFQSKQWGWLAICNDLIHIYNTSSMIESSFDSYYVVCAVCDHKHPIAVNSIPKLVQLEAQKRSGKQHPYL